MQIYALALEKGGVGKTCLAVNLAAAFSRLNLRVLVIDLDAQRTGSPLAAVAAPPTPRWLPPLHEQLVRTNQGVQRAIGRADTLGPADVETLLSDIGALLTNLTSLMARLQGGDDDSVEEEQSRERSVP